MKKKLLIAAAAAGATLSAVPAFATVYNMTGLAKAQFGSSNASFTMSLDSSTQMLTASITSSVAFAGGFGVNCCSAIGTQVAFMFANTSQPAGTYNYSLDLSNASSYDASFLSANGGTASTAYAALLSGLTTVVNVNNGATIATVRAYTSATASLAGALITTAAPVPEPASYALMALGLGLVVAVRRRGLRAEA